MEARIATFYSRPQSPQFKEYASAVVVCLPKPTIAETESRRAFLQNLRSLNGVSLANNVDNSSPPSSFRFISESVLGEGVVRTTEDWMSGCTCRTRMEDGRKIGCEYLYCECLEDSAENDLGKKPFPYSNARADAGCLRQFYLDSRHHIYECNSRCNCPSECKNRKVQHGRTIPLEIFKTQSRGWGKHYIFGLNVSDRPC